MSTYPEDSDDFEQPVEEDFPIPLQMIIEDFQKRFECFVITGVPRPGAGMGDVGKFVAFAGPKETLVYELEALKTRLIMDDMDKLGVDIQEDEAEMSARENSGDAANTPMESSEDSTEWSAVQDQVSRNRTQSD